jgi:hypothetical protein
VIRRDHASIAFSLLGLAEPRARVTRDALDKFQDLARHARLRLNPELEIFNRKRGQRMPVRAPLLLGTSLTPMIVRVRFIAVPLSA